VIVNTTSEVLVTKIVVLKNGVANETLETRITKRSITEFRMSSRTGVVVVITSKDYLLLTTMPTGIQIGWQVTIKATAEPS
jgi:hypothetical protein